MTGGSMASQAKSTLNELLVRMFNYILYIEERNLKQKGVTLSMTEVHLLESIAKSSENTMSSIAKQSMVTQGTLTTNVKTLEKKGYVERYKDENDKRIIHLRLTDEAHEVLKIHDAFHSEMIDKTLEDLDLENNEVLIQSLENILNYFEEKYESEVQS
jgi:DNA-binding MarR family transcriptional regulator